MAAVAKAHPEVTIGSYPFQDDRGPNSNIVVRSRDPDKLAAAKAAVEDMLASVRAGLRRTRLSAHDGRTRPGADFCSRPARWPPRD